MPRRKPLPENYWKKRQLDANVEKMKYREVLVDPKYVQRPIDPTKIAVSIKEVVKRNQPVSETMVWVLLHLDKFQFFTRKYIIGMNIWRRDVFDDKRAKYSTYRFCDDISRNDLVYQLIRSWELDDAEYKQRYGDDKNRHNYRKRYALTARAKMIIDDFYSLVKPTVQEKIEL